MNECLIGQIWIQCSFECVCQAIFCPHGFYNEHYFIGRKEYLYTNTFASCHCLDLYIFLYTISYCFNGCLIFVPVSSKSGLFWSWSPPIAFLFKFFKHGWQFPIYPHLINLDCYLSIMNMLRRLWILLCS